MSIEAMKQALEAIECQIQMISSMPIIRREKGEVVFAIPEAAWVGLTACITALRQAISEAEQAQPVAELTDDEIYEAAYATYCRGPNTRELFRVMWTWNRPVSIGWDRDELKAFARYIASFYTTSPPQRGEVEALRQPLTHPQIHELDWPDGVAFDEILLFVRAIERAHGIKGEL
jgi:hypothetical protein